MGNGYDKNVAHDPERTLLPADGPRGFRPLGYAPLRFGPAAPGLRYPACAAPVTGRAVSSLRSGTSRASCSLVGDVKRP